ncbi:MAG: hypothetical protein U0270_20380 [Labilithrix sp.]
MRNPGTRGYVRKVAIASASIHLGACEPRPAPPDAHDAGTKPTHAPSKT